jgi:hypothetical protein
MACDRNRILANPMYTCCIIRYLRSSSGRQLPKIDLLGPRPERCQAAGLKLTQYSNIAEWGLQIRVIPDSTEHEPITSIFHNLSTASMRLTGLRSCLSYERFGVSAPFDPACRLVTSPFFSPPSLGALRLLFAVYSLVTTITVLIFESVRFHGGSR